MSKHRQPKPERGYQWLGGAWIGAIGVVLTVAVLIDGQYRLGKRGGTLITMGDHPLTFWAGVAFPASISLGTIVFIVRSELRFRQQLRAYEHEVRNRIK